MKVVVCQHPETRGIVPARRLRRGPRGRLRLQALLLVALLPGLTSWGIAVAQPPATAEAGVPALSPYWDADIQHASATIVALARAYGFHPDFVAAVMAQESAGGQGAGGSIKVVGLLGLGSVSSTQAATPPAHLRWGMAILSYVVQQAGGDLHTALAAYVGGWEHMDSLASRDYATRVLDAYARALLVRAGLSPEMAGRWTVAIELRAGNVPEEALLLLGDKPVTGVRTFAAHTAYAFADPSGQAYYVRGYVVPIGLSELVGAEIQADGADQLEAPLRARLGEKGAPDNLNVVLICLPSLERLRGEVRTRWFAPSSCPAAER